MYSPKIDEELIPRIYRLGKLKKVPMTRLVNKILQRGLSDLEEEEREKLGIRAKAEGRKE